MNKTRWLVLPGLLIVAAAAAWWWSERPGGDAVVYRTASIERGSLQATVSASGAVNPVSQVSVGTQVSGQIRDLLVDFNSEVKAGQLIAQIDPETFEYRVRSAQADVEAAQAGVATAQASAAASRAQVARAQVDLNEAQRDFERKQSLVQVQFIAQSEADRARALVSTMAETLKATQAQVGVSEAQIRTALANVAQRQSALAQARVDLARTRITSPVDGIVIKRAIEKGQTVAASLQSPELFVIAQNLSDMQVDASVDESDVGRIRTGQRATFTVDAFPGQTFSGDVRQVRKAAQTIANVVTYVAVVNFSNATGRLLPGMTANVRIVTDQRENVLKVPNAALRVRIAGVEPVEAATAAAAQQPVASSPANGPAADAPVAPAASAAGAMQALRNRMVAELQLDAAQTARVDAAIAEARPRFMALRELPAEERPKGRERIMADLRARIGELLTPEQKTRYAALQAETAGRTNSRGRIHLLGADGKPKAFNVRLGISDGSSTELLVAPGSPAAAELREGATVIIGVQGSAATGGRTAGGPRMQF